MAGIRVRLQFPNDEKYWIYVDYACMKTVQDVMNSISEKFSVCCEKILLDDAQLPIKESVFVIQDTDLLSVHIKTKKKRTAKDLIAESETAVLADSNEQDYPQRSKKKKSKQETIDIQNEVQLPVVESTAKKEEKKVEKKKRTSEVSSMVESCMEAVRNTCLDITIPEATLRPDETSPRNVSTSQLKEQIICKLTDVEKKQAEKSCLENNHTTTESKMEGENSLDEAEEGEKAKRKRRRRKRKSHYKEESIPFVEVPATPVDYIPDHPTNRKHIRFDATQEVEREIPDSPEKPVHISSISEAEKTEKMKPSVQLFPDKEFNPFYSEESKKQKNTPFGSKQESSVKSNVQAKTSTPKSAYQSHNCSSEISQFEALLSLRSAVFTRNTKTTPSAVTPSYNNVPPPQSIVTDGSPNKSKPLKVVEPTITARPSTNAGEIDISKFPVFSGPPRLGDVLAFKILELSDNYNPEVSEYIVGRITAIETSGEITVELKEPRAKRHAFGKFELYQNEDEDAEETLEVEMETNMSFRWSQFIEPRLIYP